MKQKIEMKPKDQTKEQAKFHSKFSNKTQPKVQSYGGDEGMKVASNCSNCEAETKSVKRDFSEQAWTVLVLWNEVQKTVVDQPLCEECYGELREVLIDRSSEIEDALKEPARKPNTNDKTKIAKGSVRKAG